MNASGASCPPSNSSYTLPIPPYGPSIDNLVIDLLSSASMTFEVSEPPSSPPWTHQW